MRKGQLSLFAIIGVVFLFIGMVVFMLKGISPVKKHPTGDHGDALYIYVTDCLENLAAESAIKIGYGGGYIKNPGDARADVLMDPLNSDSLALFGGSVILPYWFYPDVMGRPVSMMPPLVKTYDDDDSVQAQMERYIEEHIGSCLDDFRPFKEQKIDVTTKSDPVVTVEFLDSKVKVNLDYEIIADDHSKILRYPEFWAEIDVRLKRLYELAKDITDSEIESLFLESITTDLINTYSLVDDDYLPPMYGGISLDDCSNRVMWFEDDVKKDMKDVLTANIPYIKVSGTDFEKFVAEGEFETEFDRDVAQGIMDRFIVGASSVPHPFIRADFTYMPDFPMDLDLGSDILGPKSYDVNMMIGHYCFMEYRFYYDLKYPVLVSLHDSKSYIRDKEGFLFQFPMMVSIVDNFPRVRKNYNPKMDKFRTYSCSRKQRLSGDVVFRVKDSSGRPVKDAFVTFQCGPTSLYEYDGNGSITNMTRFGEKCAIGRTDKDGELHDRLPPCSGRGVIGLMHPKYLKKSVLVEDIEEGEEYDFDFTLDQVVDLRVAVTKYYVKPPVPAHSSLSDPDPSIIADDNGNVVVCTMDDDASPIQPNENVIIRLYKLDDENGMLPSQPFAVYTPLNITNIKVAPGRYLADITLFRNERYPGEMTIYKNSESFHVDGGIGSSDKTMYYPEDDIILPAVMSGGALLNFTISDNVYDANQIRFYVIDEGKPVFIENVGRAVDDRLQCSILNYDRLRPRLE